MSLCPHLRQICRKTHCPPLFLQKFTHKHIHKIHSQEEDEAIGTLQVPHSVCCLYLTRLPFTRMTGTEARLLSYTVCVMLTSVIFASLYLDIASSVNVCILWCLV